MSKLFYYAKGGRLDLSNLGNRQYPGNDNSISQVNPEVEKVMSFNEGESFNIGTPQALTDNPLIKRYTEPHIQSAPINDNPRIRFGTFEFYMRFDLGQPVNQWLCVILLGCITLFIILSYVTAKAEIIGEDIKIANAEFEYVDIVSKRNQVATTTPKTNSKKSNLFKR